MQYSKRLGKIKPDQFQRALNKFSLGKFLKAKPVNEGLFGQNVFVKSDKGEFVLRGVPHSSWQFGCEKFFTELLHKKTNTPVPWPYLYDQTKDVFGWEYVIMPRLEGIQLTDSKAGNFVEDLDWIKIATAQGEMLAEAQKLTWSFPGKYNEESNNIKPFEKSFSEQIEENILKRLKKAKGYNKRTTDEDLKWVKKTLHKARSAMKLNFKPCFVMQDYKLGNMVFKKENKRLRITGLFDLMESYFGNGEADLSRTYSVYMEKKKSDLAYGFLNSYLKLKGKSKGFEERFPVFILHDKSLIWEWRQRADQPWWDKKLSFKEWCEFLTVLDRKKLV